MEQPGERAPAPGSLLLVQDLANTVELESAEDQLRTPADLEAWARQHALPRLTFDADDLAAALVLREALRDACQAHTGTRLPDAAAAKLEQLLGAAPLLLAIDAEGGAAVRPTAGLRGTAALTAHIAAGIAGAVADNTWPRLKACAAHNCRWVYYDRSPAGRSRWCTMAVCGSRAKMRAYRSRAT
ncbi:CGNR zinc finger domain-containing protein [Streptomyces sp. H39-S7]|uniref:CGNR zinc finger domain-containing protein n=1 Tax=Streptomyces sp. H39-S7 TaxID=3004357 RepID=UPI0022B0289B|nr:CGNR zinc finger domain-containing protein [Streptomyces sp. H39-S7]MCZ4122859.1 CGNR zinc finger domain-containing protein [Streptomyces sp. H39-S7]